MGGLIQSIYLGFIFIFKIYYVEYLIIDIHIKYPDEMVNADAPLE